MAHGASGLVARGLIFVWMITDIHRADGLLFGVGFVWRKVDALAFRTGLWGRAKPVRIPCA